MRFDVSVAQRPRCKLSPSATIRLDRSNMDAWRESLVEQEKWVSDGSVGVARPAGKVGV